jgi:adenine-specific DNA-methyltransferase
MKVVNKFSKDADATLYHGDTRELLAQIPDNEVQLIVTSPPYNVGKEYEKVIDLNKYLKDHEEIIKEYVRVLSPNGSICWQVGNFVKDGEVFPLDILFYPMFKKYGLKLRNRIIWHFGHGLHCSKRLSGRHETILWFTKGDDYHFDLDPIRIPQKYPTKKHFKGPNKGKLSGNPLGKNPSDVWDIPNVKSNHIEKTIHPCQFPVELIERLVLSMTKKGDLVYDPFLGVGTTAVASIRHNRRVAGADIEKKYLKVAEERIKLEDKGKLKTRPMGQPVYDPNGENIKPAFIRNKEETLSIYLAH